MLDKQYFEAQKEFSQACENFTQLLRIAGKYCLEIPSSDNKKIISKAHTVHRTILISRYKLNIVSWMVTLSKIITFGYYPRGDDFQLYLIESYHRLTDKINKLKNEVVKISETYK